MKTIGQTLQALENNCFVTLVKIPSAGSLQARRATGGGAITFTWRITGNGKSFRYTIGSYDPTAPPKSLTPTRKGYSIAAAIATATGWGEIHNEYLEIGGYPGYLDKLEQDKVQAKLALDKQQAAEVKAKTDLEKYTLAYLLADYCDHLETLGRRSWRDALSNFRINVFEAWPALASTPAKAITPDDVAGMMRAVIEKGQGRTANKLRSYLRAAFEVARASRSKPSIPIRFKAYAVTTNPAADTFPDESANKADKNPLTTKELQGYWASIKPMPGLIGAMLRLHLLSGGQRIEQLCNLLTANCTDDAIILFDGKGRPGGEARPHTVPLRPAAAMALKQCNPMGAYALSTDGGKTHVSAITLSNWAKKAANGIDDFQTKRIRSGIETLLASAKVSKDDRGHLQSHGITGVQARHYDGHDYLDEKRQALERLLTLLENKPEPLTKSKVIQLRRAA